MGNLFKYRARCAHGAGTPSHSHHHQHYRYHSISQCICASNLFFMSTTLCCHPAMDTASSTKSSFSAAISLTLQLFGVGVVSLVGAPVTFLTLPLPATQPWLVNTARSEPVVLFHRSLSAEIAEALLSFVLSFAVVPVMWCWLFWLKPWQSASVIGAYVATFVMYQALYLVVNQPDQRMVLEILQYWIVSVPWLVLLHCITPKGTRAALTGLISVVIMSFIVTSFYFFNYFVTDLWGTLLFVALLFPLAKEVGMVALRCVCRMLEDAGLPPARTCILLLCGEVIWAAWLRVCVTGLPGAFLPLALLATSVPELLVRLSLPHRTRLIQRCKDAFERLRHRHDQDKGSPVRVPSPDRQGPYYSPEPAEAWEAPQRSASADPLPALQAWQSPTTSVRRTASYTAPRTKPAGEHDLEEGSLAGGSEDAPPPAAPEAIYTSYLLCAAGAEYTGILLAHVLPVLHQHHIILVPFLQYISEGAVSWTQPLHFLPLLLSLLLQLGVELVVDSLSFCVVARYGYDVYLAWQQLSKRNFTVAAICLGAYMANGVWTWARHADLLDLCFGADLCHCAWGNGLTAGGVRQLYCEHLYTNATNFAYTINVTAV